jgi:hypothetical protein
MLPDEADDVARELHGFVGDHARPVCAIDQNGIDKAGVCDQALHLGGNRRQLCYAKLDQRVLEAGELSAAEFAEHTGLGAT